MNTERLLNVARALRESGNPDAFDMSKWHECGTPACALGHYAARQDLQDEFSLVGEGSVRSSSYGLNVFKAIKLHFEIDTGESEELFEYHDCGRAKTVLAAAEYIERFVATHLPADDGAPYCSYGHRTKADCDCGPIAKND